SSRWTPGILLEAFKRTPWNEDNHMSDQKKRDIASESGDKDLSSKEGLADDVRSGSADYSKGVKENYKARKDGARDPDTMEHLPPQPTFFDSAAASLDKAQVVTDVQDHVTSVTRADDGKTVRMEYENGQLNKLRLPNGDEWRQDAKGWTRVDKHGKVVDTLDGSVSVSENGDIVLSDSHTQTTETSHPDGSRSIQYRDGSGFTKDIAGRVTSVTNADHTTDTM